jgi:predicted MFS family arabinose efflux permease
MNRFTLAQTLAGAGDALVAVSLADSLFFSLSPDASREQVLLYLFINMVPFALLAPLIGPAIDRFRGGHRLIAVGLFVIRAMCAVALAFALLDLALYFFALALLVSAKASGVTRQALVPRLVDAHEQLVSANSRIARLNVVAGTIAGGIGAALVALGASPVALALASALFVGSAIATITVPEPAGRDDAIPSLEYVEIHMPRVSATAWAFTLVRASVGYFVFGLAFALRRESEPPWIYGAAIMAYGIGTFGGNALAPLLRRRWHEEGLTIASVISLAAVAGFGALGPSRPLVLVVAVVLGAAASVGRQAFDALVQARAPQASQGRSFARFETRFQIGWVIGAIAATAFAASIQVSMGVLVLALVPATLLYWRSIREAEDASVDDPFDPVAVARRRLDLVVEWRQRGLAEIAVAELLSSIELAAAAGAPAGRHTLERVAVLRRAVGAGIEPDPDEIGKLTALADAMITILEHRRDTPTVGLRHQPSVDEPSVDQPSVDQPPVVDTSSSPAVPAAGSVAEVGACCSTSEVDVGAHTSSVLANVARRRDHSVSDR